MISIVGLPARRIRDKDSGVTFVLDQVSSMSVWDHTDRSDAISASPHLAVHFLNGPVRSRLLEFLRQDELKIEAHSSATIMAAEPLGRGNVEVWLKQDTFDLLLQDFELAFTSDRIFVGLSWSGESYSDLERFAGWMSNRGEAPAEFWLSNAPEVQLLRRHS